MLAQSWILRGELRRQDSICTAEILSATANLEAPIVCQVVAIAALALFQNYPKKPVTFCLIFYTLCFSCETIKAQYVPTSPPQNNATCENRQNFICFHAFWWEIWLISPTEADMKWCVQKCAKHKWRWRHRQCFRISCGWIDWMEFPRKVTWRNGQNGRNRWQLAQYVSMTRKLLTWSCLGPGKIRITTHVFNGRILSLSTDRKPYLLCEGKRRVWWCCMFV